ncbi:hypothetical protein A3L04_10620 [Thermococcus chitonophagus]|uniref:Uncharacterized protein n=1 Tax=Thermococcus chitonophagus TaxID=54262 RepID=A0A160VST6_9EURY|nr:hypothetical protein [Thermococcus chitonophagus]ASJ17488.1 hypothetical protein A3L04_10620 [Thermococcus chitonophagus]CUX78137.1 hypothetical protein CHITON_1358 [Thermococcus chitonophagus]
MKSSTRKKWDLKLKILHDEKRFLLIAMGSSAIKLKGSFDLAGRAFHRKLFPMTYDLQGVSSA